MCTISPPIHAYVSVCLSVYLSSVCVCVCVCVCLSVCHIHSSIMSTFVFCVRMVIYHWYRSLLVCTPVCHTLVFSRHIHNFCRATHMHSADYTVATCLSDRLSIWLSIRRLDHHHQRSRTQTRAPNETLRTYFRGHIWRTDASSRADGLGLWLGLELKFLTKLPTLSYVA